MEKNLEKLAIVQELSTEESARIVGGVILPPSLIFRTVSTGVGSGGGFLGAAPGAVNLGGVAGAPTTPLISIGD